MVRYGKKAILTNSEKPEEQLTFHFLAIGSNTDPAKAKGCAETYAIKYFLSKFLQQFKQTQAKIKQLLWQYPYATVDVSNLTKPKLKNAIRQDIILLKEILPLEDCLVPNEDDPEM